MLEEKYLCGCMGYILSKPLSIQIEINESGNYIFFFFFIIFELMDGQWLEQNLNRDFNRAICISINVVV